MSIDLLHDSKIGRLIEQALNEDIGFGDVTSESLIPEDQFGRAILQAKENGVVSGMEVVGIVMQYRGWRNHRNCQREGWRFCVCGK